MSSPPHNKKRELEEMKYIQIFKGKLEGVYPFGIILSPLSSRKGGRG
jgi:hypothetical protein